MKKILLRAPVLSQSGYGVHSRQIARWLLSKPDVDLTVAPVQWGITPWYIDADACGGLIGELMSRAKADNGPWDVSFQVQLPNEWTPRLAAYNVGVTAGVETDVCNPDWVKRVTEMERVVVPSTFTRSVFERTCFRAKPGVSAEHVASKVAVVPESFVDAILDTDIPPLDLGIDTKFNFLLVGQMTSRAADLDRKNIFNCVKWFCEAFKDDEDVGLILKSNSGRDTKIDRKVTIDLVKETLKSVRKGPFPKVHLLHGMMSDQEMAALYRHPTVKAFVTLTRGEGFGLPILEAAASGLPVIATGWSGHMDFMGLGKFIKVDYELADLPQARIDKNIFVPGARWAQVSESDAKKKLVRFRERCETPQEWAVALKAKVREKFSFQAISAEYDSVFSGVV